MRAAYSAQTAPERIDYTPMTPISAGGALEAVWCALPRRGHRRNRLRVPSAWGGQTGLYRAISGLEIVSGGVLGDGDGPAQRIVTHRPGARVHVRYRIVQDYEGPPTAGVTNSYRPVVQPGYFHLIGEAAFVTPEDAAHETPVRVRARRLPRGWAFASDLEHEGLTLAQLWSSIIVGGDFRVVRRADPNIRVAVRGAGWSFNEASFAAEIDAIIGAQRAFWGDASSPFLVTLIQLEAPENWVSTGGTGLGDAFAFFATPNAENRQITVFLAHEAMHTWIAPQLGGLPSEDQPLHYWISEGFTDFYAPRMLLRAGIWTPRDFADELNGALRAYAQSPVRTAPNARIGADFWSDADVQRLPYQRGRLMALIWDGRLRAEGRSLDALMHAARASASAGARNMNEIFPNVAQDAGLDIAADVARFIDAGEPILLPEDLLAPCGDHHHAPGASFPSRLRYRRHQRQR